MATADSPLTDLEKKFLKQHYGGEYKFLLSNGLKIHDEEDRTEGRHILRSIMVQDGYDDEDDDGESVESNQFLADMEEDPTSHLAGCHFSEKELDWVQKHYRHSGNFMQSHGLKPFDD